MSTPPDLGWFGTAAEVIQSHRRLVGDPSAMLPEAPDLLAAVDTLVHAIAPADAPAPPRGWLAFRAVETGKGIRWEPGGIPLREVDVRRARQWIGGSWQRSHLACGAGWFAFPIVPETFWDEANSKGGEPTCPSCGALLPQATG